MCDILLLLLTSVFAPGSSEVAYVGLFVSRRPSFFPTGHACSSVQSLMDSLNFAAQGGICLVQSPQARVLGPSLSQYELSVYCQVAETIDFHMFFLVPLIFRPPCRVFFLFLYNYQLSSIFFSISKLVSSMESFW